MMDRLFVGCAVVAFVIAAVVVGLLAVAIEWRIGQLLWEATGL